MKRVISLMLALTLSLALCACGAQTQETTNTTVQDAAETPAKETAEAPAQDAVETPAQEIAETTVETTAVEGESTVINIGVLTMLNLSEEEMEDYFSAVITATEALLKNGGATSEMENPPAEIVDKNVIFYDSLDAMLMALNAGDIDIMCTYNSTADYLVANNEELVKDISFNYGPDSEEGLSKMLITGILNNSFSFMMMEGNEALRDEFNKAIADMENEGLLDTLLKEQMLTAVDGHDPKPVEMPVIDGADTVKVAVTGSLPPMDYVAADGTPAGYNTAVLAEISKRINKNIELVVVDSIGRAAALSSGTVDVVFWTRSNDMANIAADASEEERAKGSEDVDSKLYPDEIETITKINELVDYASIGQNDMPDGTIITKSYFKDSIVPVMTKSGMEALKSN